MLEKQAKSEMIKKFATHASDTGSSQVQISILTGRIKQISEHLQAFPKDKHSRHGLVKLVGQRRTLTNYLKRKDRKAHSQVMEFLKSQKTK